MDEDRFEYILAVAEEKNITKAAKKLYVSQPAISKYITKLESELGIALFDRTENPVKLTEAGSFYIEKMKDIMQRKKALKDEMYDLAYGNQCRPLFRLGLGNLKLSQWGPEIYRVFLESVSDYDLEFYTSSDRNLLDLLHSDRLDMIVTDAIPEPDDEHYDLLDEEMIYIIYPRSWDAFSGLSKEEGTPENPIEINIRDFSSKPFIVSGGSVYFHKIARDLFKDNDYKHAGRLLYCPNMLAAIRMVADGLAGAFYLAFKSNPRLYMSDLLDSVVCCIPEASALPRSVYSIPAHNISMRKADIYNSVLHTIKNRILIPS